MRKYLFTTAALTTLMLCSLMGAKAQTELVVNGGFETGDFTGWTTSDLNFVTQGPDFAHDGTFGEAYGTVGHTASLFQTLNTTVGATEQISFWQHQVDETPNRMKFSFDGVTLVDAVNLPVRDWFHYTFTFVAVSTTSVLQFDLRDDPGFSAIDTVSVREFPAASNTPEGDSLFLLSGGLLPIIGAGLWRRRRNQKV